MKSITMTLIAAASMWLPVEASAQTGPSGGGFSPFCNVLTLTVVAQGNAYRSGRHRRRLW